MKKILIILFIGCVVSSLNAQCLIYNSVGKSTSSGQRSSAFARRGFVLIVPTDGSDGKKHFSAVNFDLYQGRYYKDFYYFENSVTDDGNGSVYGGFSSAVVKIGTKYFFIASQGPFNSETFSGLATLGPIARTQHVDYYAKTLTGSYAFYGQDEGETDELGSTSSAYQRAYKYSSVNAYTLNENYTRAVIDMSYDDAKNYIINLLVSLGYTDRIANPYP